MDTPLLLDDFKSYLLFLVGTIMALLALNKSYRNDDIYPDYGRYDRQMNKIKGEYLSFVEDLYDEMQIIVEKGTDKLSANWEYRKRLLRTLMKELVDLNRSREIMRCGLPICLQSGILFMGNIDRKI